MDPSTSRGITLRYRPLTLFDNTFKTVIEHWQCYSRSIPSPDHSSPLWGLSWFITNLTDRVPVPKHINVNMILYSWCCIRSPTFIFIVVRSRLSICRRPSKSLKCVYDWCSSWFLGTAFLLRDGLGLMIVKSFSFVDILPWTSGLGFYCQIHEQDPLLVDQRLQPTSCFTKSTVNFLLVLRLLLEIYRLGWKLR
jgi:hypothetical protein